MADREVSQTVTFSEEHVFDQAPGGCVVATLLERLHAELDNWRERLPPAWRKHFDDIALDFGAVDPRCELTPSERIWPQGNSPNKAARLFKALNDLRPDQVRVVIFGNDPYTKLVQATGRSFEQGDLINWAQDIRIRGHISPSMQSIVAAAAATDKNNARYSLCDTRMLYDEPEATKEPTASQIQAQPIWFAHVELARALADGAAQLPPPTQIFGHWAKQGVLWLNRTLTYTKWDAVHRTSHRELWAPFTARTLEVLVQQGNKHPIVFVMWGASAQQLEPKIRKLATDFKIDRAAIRCCKTGHPQWVVDYFKSGNPLVAINEAIAKSGKTIVWK